jgi:hypothetical protein
VFRFTLDHAPSNVTSNRGDNRSAKSAPKVGALKSLLSTLKSRIAS